jgi:hypothetical protein
VHGCRECLAGVQTCVPHHPSGGSIRGMPESYRISQNEEDDWGVPTRPPRSCGHLREPHRRPLLGREQASQPMVSSPSAYFWSTAFVATSAGHQRRGQGWRSHHAVTRVPERTRNGSSALIAPAVPKRTIGPQIGGPIRVRANPALSPPSQAGTEPSRLRLRAGESP